MPKKSAKKEAEEVIVKPQYPYEDARGRMDYHVLTEPINWVGTITTKKGAIRANHFHPEQEQKLLLVSGKCISVYKDLAAPEGAIKHHLVEAGDLVITPPNVAHAVLYIEDCVQMNLVKGERIPDNYGKHTKPYKLVGPEEFQKYAAMYGQ